MMLLLALSCSETPLLLRFEPLGLADVAVATDFVFLPDTTDELLLVTKDGLLHHLRIETSGVSELGRWSLPRAPGPEAEATKVAAPPPVGVYSDTDCGLVSIALAPDFAASRQLYFGTCTSLTASGIVRGTWPTATSGDLAIAPLLIVEEPTADRPWHNVGSIGFEADGETLWAVFGEKVMSDRAQEPDNLLGSLIRIVPQPDGSVRPAAGNPGGDWAPEVHSIGLRSPWRATLDDQGRYWIGDVGSSIVEEINVIDAAGTNLGWPRAEGPCAGNCADLTDPVTAWDRGGSHPYLAEDAYLQPASRSVVWVGEVVAPHPADPYGGRLDHQLLFGDYCLGFVRALSIDDDGAIDRDVHLGHLARTVQMRRGPDGFVYGATFGVCGTSALNLDEADPPPADLHRAVVVDD